jgi:hypothetical protein
MYRAPYLATELACHLQLLLVPASAVIPGIEPHVTHNFMLLSQIRNYPCLMVTFPYVYPPQSYTLRHCVPFPSPLMI